MGLRRMRACSVGLLLLTGLLLLGQAGWIQAKAELAQLLLQQAWQRTLEDGAVHRPWPWADHWPVAELQGPEAQQRYIVLAGDQGSSLAFAPGHNLLSGLPGEPRTSIISGHRDTHFRWLKQLQPGQILQLRSRQAQQRYRIVKIEVVDSRSHRIAIHPRPQLVLVTCWPFDSLDSGGPLRLLVQAEALDEAPAPPLFSNAGAAPPPAASVDRFRGTIASSSARHPLRSATTESPGRRPAASR